MPADYYVEQTDMKAVADAIRTKGQTTAPLTFPDGMVQAVNEISTAPEGPVIDMVIYDPYYGMPYSSLDWVSDDGGSFNLAGKKGYLIPKSFDDSDLSQSDRNVCDELYGEITDNWVAVDLSDATTIPQRPSNILPSENIRTYYALVQKDGHTGILIYRIGVEFT